eukprot:scaffold1964_cov302-Pinguiococcus_pyrenoidosus.AAC.3
MVVKQSVPHTCSQESLASAWLFMHCLRISPNLNLRPFSRFSFFTTSPPPISKECSGGAPRGRKRLLWRQRRAFLLGQTDRVQVDDGVCPLFRRSLLEICHDDRRRNLQHIFFAADFVLLPPLSYSTACPSTTPLTSWPSRSAMERSWASPGASARWWSAWWARAWWAAASWRF